MNLFQPSRMPPRAFWFTAIPIAGSTLYFVWLHSSLTRNVRCHTTANLQSSDLSLPKDVSCDGSEHVIMHERASKVVPTALLPRYGSPDGLLTSYLRHNMVAFSKYPPAWMIYFFIRDPAVRATFGAAHLRSLEYQVGDLVNGVYRVVTRTPRKAELIFDPPESYTGPPITGLLVIEIQESGDQTTFVNDTVMWRPKNGKPVPLESKMGRWSHEIIAASLVEGGTKKLINEAKR